MLTHVRNLAGRGSGIPIQPIHPDFADLGPLLGFTGTIANLVAALVIGLAVLVVVVGAGMLLFGTGHHSHRRGLQMIIGAVSAVVVVLAASWLIKLAVTAGSHAFGS